MVSGPGVVTRGVVGAAAPETRCPAEPAGCPCCGRGWRGLPEHARGWGDRSNNNNKTNNLCYAKFISILCVICIMYYDSIYSVGVHQNV